MNAKKEIEQEVLNLCEKIGETWTDDDLFQFVDDFSPHLKASLERLYQMGYDEGVKEEIGQAKYWQNEWVKLNNELYKEQQKSNLLKSKKNG
jgi:hypothetical protein